MKSAKKYRHKKSSVFGGVFNSKRLTALIVFVVVFAGIGTYLLSSSHAYNINVESDQYNQLNNYRAEHSKSKLSLDGCIANKAHAWAQHMADNGHLVSSLTFSTSHDLINDEAHYLDCGGHNIGENIGNGPSAQSIFAAWDQNPTYKENMLSDTFSSIGVGAVKGADGSWWLVQAYTD